MERVIRLGPCVVLIGAIGLIQAHGIAFWSGKLGPYGIAWSVLLEATALWLWSRPAIGSRALACLASVLLLLGPLYQVGTPILDIEGRGHYYPTREAAYLALRAYLDRGGRRADVGLMQIHWRAHHRLLRDPWTALDPMFNLRVGAYLLRERWQAAGNLWQAIGHYHAPNWPERAAWYRRQVARRLGQLRAGGGS